MPHRHNRRLSQKKSDCNGINATVQINSPMVAPPGGKPRAARAHSGFLVIAGIIAPYEQFIRLYESPNIINSAVAIVVLTGKQKGGGDKLERCN